jgi:hypothetical protein
MPARDFELVERYLDEIRKAAADAPEADRNEFIEEIRSHIIDRLAATNDVDAVLRAIGDPRQLAGQFTSQVGLRREARSFSPWSLLRGMLRWSVAGTAGLISFLLAVFGYGCATVFFASLLLKPLFPDRVGLWLGPESTVTHGFWDGRLVNSHVYGITMRPVFDFALGTLSPTDGPIREVAGQHIYTIGVLFGALTLFGTTLFSRWVMRRLGRRRWFASSKQNGPPLSAVRAAGSGLPR